MFRCWSQALIIRCQIDLCDEATDAQAFIRRSLEAMHEAEGRCEDAIKAQNPVKLVGHTSSLARLANRLVDVDKIFLNLIVFFKCYEKLTKDICFLIGCFKWPKGRLKTQKILTINVK